MNYEFNKNHTLFVKGIAIVLMLIHHLFAFPERLMYSYISFMNIEFYIAEFGKMCVSIFLFLSGYGLYYSLSSDFKDNLKKCFERIKNIYLNYWIVFIIFIPIGFVLFNIRFDLIEFILNFLGIKSTYNYEWWFFRTYIFLVLIAPLTINKINNKSIIAFSQCFYGFIIGNVFRIMLNIFNINDSYILNEIVNLLTWSPCFYIGIFYAKFNGFRKSNNFFKKYNLNTRIIYIALILFCGIVREVIPGGTGRDALLTPIFIISIDGLLYNTAVNKPLIYLGKYSNNIWLVHSFFCYYYFQWLIFLPKLSIVILFLLIFISLWSAYMIEYCKNIIQIKKINSIS